MKVLRDSKHFAIPQKFTELEKMSRLQKISQNSKISLAFFAYLIYNIRAVSAVIENAQQPKTKYATVAQLVEQLIRNQQVGGSSPPSSSKRGYRKNGNLFL